MPPTPHTATMTPPGVPELRAFIYDRVSRLNPRSGSVRDQSLENRRLCEARGWRVVEEFEDPGKSASRYAKTLRPRYQDMIGRVRNGECDVIVVWEASRAYRNTHTYLELRDLCESTGTLLCYNNGRGFDMARSDDRFSTHLDALLAEREADAIRDRNLRTTRLNAERGGPHGKVPYGYRREYDPDKGTLLRQAVDEEKAAVVREIAGRVADGQSLSSILKDLHERGVPAPRGERWTLTTLRNLVTRPTNIGKRTHLGQVVGDALWEPILDEGVYYACLKLVCDPARLTHRDASLRHVLAGVPVCGPCLYSLAPQDVSMRSARVKGVFVYTCRRCYRAAVRADLLEAYVQRAVLARIESPEFAAALRPDVAQDVVRRALAEAELLEGQLEEARRLFATVTAAGRMALSAADFASLSGRLTPMIEAARARAADATLPPVLRLVAGPGARERWEEKLDIADRRAVVRSVARVTVHRAGRGARGIGPGRVSIGWLL